MYREGDDSLMPRKSEETHWDRVARLDQETKDSTEKEVRSTIKALGVDHRRLRVSVHSAAHIRILEVSVYLTQESVTYPGALAMREDLARSIAATEEFLPGWVQKTYGLELKGPSEEVHGAGLPQGTLFGRIWRFHGARMGTKGEPG
jgi:hypothetical protein